MGADPRTRDEVLAEIAELRARLDEPEQTVHAIRSGGVDAFVVADGTGDRVYTLSGADPPYRSMIERMQEGATLLSADGVVLYANRRLAEMLRAPADELALTSFHDVVTPGVRPILDDLLRQSSPGESRGELLLTARDGVDVPVTVAVSDLTSGGIPLVFMVVTDLSEHKRSQQMIAERTTEAEGLAVRLRSLTAKLVLAEQRERHRLASELHDYLAQNLVVCRMAIDRSMRTRGADQRALLEEANNALTECIGYCRSMVADLSPTVLYQAGLYAGLRWLGQRMGRHGLRVDLDLEETFVPEEDQAVLLFQSVRELLFNVLKHSQVDRAVVQVRDRGGEFFLTVADAGRGFDPAAPMSLESANAFGLFAVREQLSNIGGRCEIESGPQGTRITLSLPHAIHAPPLPPASVSAPGRIRVLLADDHATVREGLRRLLMEDPELEVVGEAAHGDEAIMLARALHPDVVLMDIHMPKTDGITATREIKRELGQIHVIGLSMHDGSEFAEAMLRAGASAYLTKDGRGAELLAAIHACCSPISAGAPLAVPPGPQPRA